MKDRSDNKANTIKRTLSYILLPTTYGNTRNLRTDKSDYKVTMKPNFETGYYR